MCGEQGGVLPAGNSLIGSPPRVRGTAGTGRNSNAGFRITPACAGNRHFSVFIHEKIRDHPRVCGEQLSKSDLTGVPQGSPPRVRGTAFRFQFCRNRSRITPACAGNRSTSTARSSGPEDHPRVCGEQSHSSMIQPSALGSPPRVRGTVSSLVIPWLNRRITPACAGNSSAAQDVCTRL